MGEKALFYYKDGYNCAQSVLKSVQENINLSENKEELLKISMGFGSGMFIGETCGAVTGAIMALSLKYGTDIANDRENTKKLYKQIKIFEKNFKEKNCTLNCKELKTVYKIDCEKLIKDSTEQLKEQLKNSGS